MNSRTSNSCQKINNSTDNNGNTNNSTDNSSSLSRFKQKIGDYSSDQFKESFAKYYKPFDTVGKLNESIENKLLKDLVNLALFVAGSVFFLFSTFTLYKLYTTGYKILMDTRLYLFAMILMLTADVVAVVTEGKDILEDIKNKKAGDEFNKSVSMTSIISISISFIIGIVTAYMIYNSWTDYRAGIKKIAPDLIAITIMKMVLAMVIAYKSGKILWTNL